jgi:Polysaccharide lyase
MTFMFKLSRRGARLRTNPALLLPLVAACAGGDPTGVATDDTPDNSPIISGASQATPVVILPRSVTTESTVTVQFRAFASADTNAAPLSSVEWSATGGSITASGLYTPSGTGSFQVVARRKDNPLTTADTAVVNVVAPQDSQVGITMSAPDTSAMAAPPTAQSTAGSVLWNADLESGRWPSGTSIVQCADGRVKIYTATTKPFANSPKPRVGTYAVKTETRDSDYRCGGTSSSRSQVASPRVLKNGGEYWIAYSTYFPNDFPSIDRYFFMFTELYYTGCGEPAVALYLTNGSSAKISVNAGYNPATRSNHRVALLDRPLGQWIDLLFHVKISTTSGGFIELWRNGVNVPLTGGVTRNGVSRLNAITMNDCDATGGSALILNNYRSHDNTTSTGKTVLYFDGVKIGATRAAVDPRASGSALLASR